MQIYLGEDFSPSRSMVDGAADWNMRHALTLEATGDMLVGGMENSQNDSHIRPGPDFHDYPPFSVMNIGRPYYKPLGDQVLLDVQGQSYLDSIGAVYVCESLPPDP